MTIPRIGLILTWLTHYHGSGAALSRHVAARLRAAIVKSVSSQRNDATGYGVATEGRRYGIIVAACLCAANASK
ncbi:hypothetical protein FJZ31_27040 [Candidatus Poribacteria bacterium]|nr:hypothetical protein [Candidatus Poribacteria bacterium]